MAEVLNELNVNGVPLEVFRMGVINPDERRPIKVVFSSSHDVIQALRRSHLLKGSSKYSFVYIRPSYSVVTRKVSFMECRDDPTGFYTIYNNQVDKRGAAVSRKQ